MAHERGTPVGEEVGYHVRFDRRAGPRTRILVVTEGILLRMLQDDPFLESVAVVVFDEFHERNLASDLALAMVRRVRDTVRPELALVVMSATLDGEPVARYLGGCPVIESRGRLHPVEITYLEPPDQQSLADRTAAAVHRILDQSQGDVLVFLPGVGEIRQTARRLEPLAAARDLAVMPLYGDLPAEKQDAVLNPSQRRKVVLATNVAETSITIEGITAVVDSGLARSLVFDPHVGMDRLEIVRISQASADQRAGAPVARNPASVCASGPSAPIRADRSAKSPRSVASTWRGQCSSLRWGESDPRAFPWFEPPSDAALAHAESLLGRLDALDAAGKITALGRTMARMPVSPRLGRMLLEGHRLGHPETVALAAALLSERDPFPRSEEAVSGRPLLPTPSNSDVLDRVAALATFEQFGRLDTKLGPIQRHAARFVLHVRDQLLRELRAVPGPRAAAPATADQAVLRSLLVAFPDRLARRTSPGSRFGRMVGARGVRLAASSAVRDAPLFVAVDVDRGVSEALVWKASAVERDWLPAEHLVLRSEVEFDPSAQRIVARRRLYWDDLLLEESPQPLPETAEVARVLAEAAAGSVQAVFPWNDRATVDYLCRVRALGEWVPELGLPPLGDEDLGALVAAVAPGCRSFEDLRKAPWLSAIQRLLTHQQRHAVECEAPRDDRGSQRQPHQAPV